MLSEYTGRLSSSLQKKPVYANLKGILRSPIYCLKGGDCMGIDKTQKQNIISEYKQHEKDTGSPEVQIAILSNRIVYLTEHFKTHAKDHHSRRGLLKLVSQRRKLLDYVKSKNKERYDNVIGRLGIRK
jgi:small subunit ribosomal protein S15